MLNGFKFFNLPLENPALPEDRRLLYRALSSALSFVPLMLLFSAAGHVVIYILAYFNILGTPDSKLLALAGISVLTALLNLFFYNALRADRLDTAALGMAIVNGVGGASQTFFWQGVWPLTLIVSLSPVLIFNFLPGLSRRAKIALWVIGAALAASILLIDSQTGYVRLSLRYLANMAAYVLYLTIITLMISLVLTNAIFQFKTIAQRLIITFALIGSMSVITTMVIVALSSFHFNQQSVYAQLRGISDIKQAEIENILASVENEVSLPLEDPLSLQRIQFLLEASPDKFAYAFNYDLVRANLVKLQQQSRRYSEVFILDDLGRVLISTTRANERQILAPQRFFSRALQNEIFTIEPPAPGSPNAVLYITRPIEKNGRFLGILVARASLDEIRAVMESSTGIAKTLETYLVGADYRAITKTRLGEGQSIVTNAAIEAIGSEARQGQGQYTNYQNQIVLGNYIYLPRLETVLVSEVLQSEVLTSILLLTFSNILVGIFTVVMAFAIVFVTSRTISGPISDLAQRATLLAQGKLDQRIELSREDEIGQLANTFNQVAGELQTLISSLETQVSERTADLQKQASRLRVAAEVSRDATSSRSLDELLNRSAQLVLDRFDFYHTGIFLMDEHHEYAILRASPTEAGKAMLQRNHRLRVGQVGIVGYVAASGEPRIALDTGQDATYFNNPLLPNTRSEMGLPLKVNDKVIGVLDVQSEKPDAFSQDDIAALQVMADQLALAIQRAELVQELEANLKEMEQTYRQFTLSSWHTFSALENRKSGYQYDGNQLIPLSSLPTETAQTLREGKSHLAPRPQENGTTLTVPVKLRGQVIGAVKLDFSTPALSSETINLAEEAANRLAVALENARLYTETQRQAERERLSSEIAARISASVNVENILRTAAQELGRLTPGAEIVIDMQEGHPEA